MPLTLRITFLAILLLAGLLVSMRASTGGPFVLPLDDAYIYFQYALQNTQGATLQYNDGDPRTTGATSLLYLLVVTPLALVFKGSALAVAVTVLALVLFILTLRSVHRIAAGWLGAAYAWPTTLLTALSGPFLWGVYSGMEIALVAFLATRLVEEFSWIAHGNDDDDVTHIFSRPWFVLMAALFATSRPEAAALTAGLVLTTLMLRGQAGPLRSIGVWVPLAACALPFAVNLGLTGDLRSTTLLSKGAQYLPGTTWQVWWIESTQFLMHTVKGLFASGDATDPNWPSAYTTLAAFAAPLSLFFIVLGLFPALTHEWRLRRPGVAWAAGLIVGGSVLLWAVLVPINLHWNRYLLPYLPLVTLFLVGGVARFSSFMENVQQRETIRNGLLLFFVVMSFPILLYFVALFGWNCGEIRHQHVAVGEWIRENTPSSARVGTNDVGAIRYYGGRDVVDFHGLTSRDFALAKQVGSSGIWEEIESMSPADRPDYLVVIPGWYENNFLRLHRRLKTQSLRRPVIAGSPLVIYKADWRAAGSDAEPGPQLRGRVGGRRLVAEIDVADLESEAAVDYVAHLLPGDSAGPLGILKLPGTDSDAVDGGRLITDYEEMRIDLTPGRDALLVMRAMGALIAGLEVDGEEVAPINGGAPAEEWTEVLVSIPGRAIREVPSTLRITARNGALLEGGYTSFHYWIYQ